MEEETAALPQFCDATSPKIKVVAGVRVQEELKPVRLLLPAVHILSPGRTSGNPRDLLCYKYRFGSSRKSL